MAGTAPAGEAWPGGIPTLKQGGPAPWEVGQGVGTRQKGWPGEPSLMRPPTQRDVDEEEGTLDPFYPHYCAVSTFHRLSQLVLKMEYLLLLSRESQVEKWSSRFSLLHLCGTQTSKR